ncbi:MAG TPA: F0F1 ATP synthase subunit delta [Opitutaceae bacterium]|nr:F0F1 ATP synthase subunit delta [Opitutaceae bacterium]
MASHAKIAQQFARQLFSLSLVDGAVSGDRVAGVLEYIEKHETPNPVMVLKAYYRLIATEVAKGQAIVEHAGAVDDAMLSAIAAAMTRRYGRAVTATARPNAGLLAGLRVHIGDDIYESSIAGQLAALASSV